MNWLLQREPSETTRTHGGIYVDGVWQCYSLEDVVRSVKIKGETAIPPGRYRLSFEDSARFGPDTITINGVPGFTHIRIHGGNSENDSSGCPLVGMERTATGIRNCAPALNTLKRLLRQGLEDGEVWIDIKNAPNYP